MKWLTKQEKTTNCFFCSLIVNEKKSFELEYKAADGVGKVRMCPMCASMLNDMPSMLKGVSDG